MQNYDFENFIGTKQYFKQVGNRLREERKATGLSIDDILIKIGISYDHYNKIENGINKPSLALIVKLCLYINCDLNYVLTGKVGLNSSLNSVIDLSTQDQSDIKDVLNILIKLCKRKE